jgi:uncharacterized membrane protein YfcA
MVPTACSASFAHYRRGVLDLDWVRRLAPGAAIGAVIGSQLTAAASARWVAIVFAVYTGYFALKMLRDSLLAPRPPGRIARTVARVPVHVVGALIGALSAAAGVGGATLTVAFVTSAGVDMKRAVAISSATGLAIAVAGAAGFASVAVADPYAGLTGLVHWPAALTLAVSATLMAPRGVAAAHMLPVCQLKRAFGALLIAACAATILKAVDTTERVEYVESAERCAAQQSSAAQCIREQQSRLLPVAAHRALGDVERLGDLLFAQADEVTHLDHLHQAWVATR